MHSSIPSTLKPGLDQFYENLPQSLQQPAQSAEFAAAMARVFVSSEYAARLCLQKPALLLDLIESGDLQREYTQQDYLHKLQQGLQSLTEQVDEAALAKILREFRQREMLRIIWRDISGLSALQGTTNNLSYLAEACLQQALARLFAWQCQESGTPCDEAGHTQHLIVIAMGKLGAHELNLSSDIDLVFTFPSEGQIQATARPLSHSQFFQRLGQRLIKAIATPTAEGFVFRVDMRLRPFGDSGPLVCSFSAMEDYYQMHGREWERYAWIKARVIAGDSTQGEEIMQRIKPFVYRRYLDYGAYESLREMKQMIQKQVLKKGMQRNIKLGAGGIREVEFIAQVFQLIRGGREPRLQQRELLNILEALAQMGLLPEYVTQQLAQAYIFLRNTEHRLQAYMDAQTHLLPEDELGQARLAFAMGCNDWHSFNQQLVEHRAHINEHFAQVFVAPQTEQREDELSVLTLLWLQQLEQAEIHAQLAALGFGDVEQITQRLKSLHDSHAYQHLSARGKSRLDHLMPLLLAACSAHAQADAAILRSLEIVTAIVRRSVYIALLVENPMALSQLVRLSAASPWITRYLSQHPILLDELLDARNLYRLQDKALLARELRQRLGSVQVNDEEQQLDALRHFKHVQVLRVAAADISGVLPLMQVSDQLTHIAEVVTDEALEMAWQHMLVKHGRPLCQADGQVCDKGFAVIGYGKLGGIELGYGSDLDIVFLHGGEKDDLLTDGGKPIPLSVFFARLSQRLIHVLTALTPAGNLYEVDLRLRPDGAAGMLVSSMRSFEQYQSQQAWTWEHQALVRARYICGDPLIAGQFQRIRRQVLGQQRNVAALKTDILQMRGKMREQLDKAKSGEFDLKHSQGGIVDIEFMVQYGVLAWACQHPQLLEFTDNIRLLQQLSEAEIITAADAEILSNAYRTYRDRVHGLKLQEQPAIVAAHEYTALREKVQACWATMFEQD